MQGHDGLSGEFNQDEFGLPSVDAVPPAIQGEDGRKRTMEVANLCAAAAPSFEEFASWMHAWNRTCEPPWDGVGYEGIDYWIKDAWGFVRGGNAPVEREEILRVANKKKSFRELDKIAFTARGQYDQFLAEIKDRPIPTSEKVIDQLYPGNPLLCRSMERESYAFTDDRESIRGVEEKYEWIVPSPMAAKWGWNGKGKKSYRCRENAARIRSYLIVEFDFGETFKKHIDAWAKEGISPRDVQIALIYFLAATGEPRRFPFMIVDSGGKSLHSWFAIGAKFPESAALALLSRALVFGADKRAEYPEQFFRFPGGTRSSEKGQPQPILFYDPRTIR